jgi:MFS family permease
MPVHPAYAQVSALLVAVFILIAGNGLSNTLIPLSATAAAFPPLSIGLIASAYFGGMLVGCIATPRIIARAGHIRAFSAFVAIATVTTLLHPIFIDPAAWALIRAVTGFCFAGLYATIESWMHDKAENVVRGQVLALYQIVHYAGSAAGQQAIRLISPASFVPFSMVAAALALSVLPHRGFGSPGCSASRRSGSSAPWCREPRTERSGRCRRCSPSAAACRQAASRAS